MATRNSPHGSTARAKSGCPCRACDARRTDLYMTTPRKPIVPPTRRIGDTVVTMVGGTSAPTKVMVSVVGDALVDVDQLAHGEAVFVSTEHQRANGSTYATVHGYMTLSTWNDVVLATDAAMTQCQQLISDVEAKVPHAVKQDLTGFQRTKHRRVAPGDDPKAPVDLAVLHTQLVNVTSSLASGGMELDVAMKQYGRLRDQIAKRRAQFTESEGVFAVLQQLIIEKAGQ